MKVLIFVCCFFSTLFFNHQLYSQNFFPVQPGDVHTFNTYSWSQSGCGNPVIGNSVLNITSVQNTHNGIDYVSFFGKDYLYDSLDNILYIYRPSGDKIAVDFNKISGLALLYYDQVDLGILFSISCSNQYFAGKYRQIYKIAYTYSYRDSLGFPWNATTRSYSFAEGIGEIEYYYYSTGAPAPGLSFTTLQLRTLLTITRGSTILNYFEAPGLTVNVPTGGTAELNWHNKQNFENSFELERKAWYDTGFVSYASFPPDSLSFTDTVTFGKSYSYTLKAVYLNFQSITDTADINVIIQPSSLIATNLGNLKIKTNWSYNSVCDSFVLSRSSRWASAGEWSDFTRIVSLNGNALTFIDSSLSAGYQYKYSICSFYQNISSPKTYSNFIYPSFPLASPLEFTAELNQFEAVELNWREVNSYENIKYTLSRKRSDSVGVTILATNLTDTMFTDETIIQNKTYIYWVKAVVGKTNSITVSAAPLDIPPFLQILPPGNITAEINLNNKVLVSWTDNSSNEKYFDIGRGSTPENLHLIDSVGFNNISYVDNDPLLTGSNKELYYGVRGRNPHSTSDWSISIITGLDDINLIEYKFEISQNYPNPFNPETIIKYSLAEETKVLIKIFDILGSEVTTLVNERLPRGSYKAVWNAASLPSGIYFYRINAGSFNDTKKMILMK